VTTLVFGGSAGVGRALCRALVAKGKDVTIVARDSNDLRAESAHCGLLNNVHVDWIAVDASDPASVRSALTNYLANGERRFENLLFPIGGAAESDRIDNTDEEFIRTLHTNLTSIMVAVSTLLPRMASQGSRNIVGFGSIAAVRGRSSNVAYSAAKRGLESYFESLRHSVVGSGISVQFYRLGYIQTQQSFGKRLLVPAMRPSAVAQHVIKNMDHDIGMQSLPRFWAGASLIVRHIPWRIFRNLNF
jgi:NAD(P)-dependent dehydrogenase (short-subunit alcohol dehydrogenase family)